MDLNLASLNSRWRVNPFTGVKYPVELSENHAVALFDNGLYGIYLNESPDDETGKTPQVTFLVGSVAGVEVFTNPGPGEFRVHYSETGYPATGFVQFNSADVNKELDIVYYGLGTIIHNAFNIRNTVPTITTSAAIEGALTCTDSVLYKGDSLETRFINAFIADFSEYTTSGTYNKTFSADAPAAFIEMVGAGGGGGGGTGSGATGASGWGGGSGERKSFMVRLYGTGIAKCTAVVGAGGSGGSTSGGSGADGGVTTISFYTASDVLVATYTAYAGKGGEGGGSYSQNGSNGFDPGGDTMLLSFNGGQFGGNGGGNGSAGGDTVSAGDATYPGGGGGGGGADSAAAGGDGAPGLVRIWA